MKTIHINTIVLGTALILAGGAIGQAGPSPDLMNSMHRLRLEAERHAKACGATSTSAAAGVTYGSWSRTQNITAGQSSVTVPDLLHQVLPERSAGDFKVAPLLQPNSTPESK